AIDEAEDEWSRHNSKKLMTQAQRGCVVQSPRTSHTSRTSTADDEQQFKTNFGLNVI
ncbi:hypothetical protein U1Q18_004363, partial [Sarracenia purpurea var. burkii]